MALGANRKRPNAGMMIELILAIQPGAAVSELLR
eukprot:CAMPEP_0180668784 /NCGR_PEP_ID=MMETSP1037_2-20121125/63120_1 /TAXON_ID=632150 /ORGANISM="Azadinium spinosum, Strain 3D9" /LENGTH=33 /DNA_ID= /DNA_START= /DNA_END= /DNA_ORIENTATION=